MTPPITRDGDGVFVDSDGVKRRTILAGAAWSIPVISVATAAPAFAATNDLTLAFDKSSYSGEACKTITGVKVTATRNGAAAAGESVTVTLADGYTFSDGSTSYTATTGSDGSITLPDIKVPSKGGDSTFSATSGSASTSASVSATPSSKTGIYKNNASDPIANSSTAIKSIANASAGAYYFQSSDGSIRDSGGSLVSGTASGVNTDAALTSLNSDSLWYKKSDGVYRYNYSTGTTTGPISNSKNATSLISDGGSGAFWFQSSDGSIRASDGGLVSGTSTGVDTGRSLTSLNSNAVWYKKSDGVYKYNYTDSTTTGPIANSKNATQLISDGGSGRFYFQSSDGTIRDSNGDLVAGTAKDVDTKTGLAASNSDSIWYKKSPACS